jgi:hypothetical protein
MAATVDPALMAITTTLAIATNMTEAKPEIMMPKVENSHLLRFNTLFFNCSSPLLAFS